MTEKERQFWCMGYELGLWDTHGAHIIVVPFRERLEETQ